MRTYIKFFLKKYCSELVEGVDLIFGILRQIFGQDDVSANPNSILAKGYCQKICFNDGFVCNRIFNNSLRCKEKIQQTTEKLKREPIRVVKF